MKIFALIFLATLSVASPYDLHGRELEAANDVRAASDEFVQDSLLRLRQLIRAHKDPWEEFPLVPRLASPLYANGILEILLTEQEEWGSSDRRDALLAMLKNSTSNRMGTWNDFARHPLRPSIQAKMRTLLAKLPPEGMRAEKIKRVYHNLELWDLADLDYVLQQTVEDVHTRTYPDILMRLLPQASAEQRQQALTIFRKHGSVSGLGVSFLLGLLQPEDIETVLRIRLLQISVYVKAMRDKEIYSLVDQKFAEMLQDGDPHFRNLYDTYRRERQWPGRTFTAPQQAQVLEYLRNLWTRQIFAQVQHERCQSQLK